MIEPTWYVLPLTACVSVVYNASRYEMPDRILKRSLRMFCVILVAMTVLYLLLYLLSVRL